MDGYEGLFWRNGIICKAKLYLRFNLRLFAFFKLKLVFLQSEKRSSNFMYLMVEFPRVKSNDKEYSIVYYEKVIS